MNRSFLIVLIPALIVGVAWVVAMRSLKLGISYFPFVMAGVGFLALIGVVQFYRKRHPKRPNT